MATASLGRLTLDLVARIGQFVEPLSKAERQTAKSMQSIERQTQKSVQAIENSVNQAKQTISAFAATAGVSFSISQIVNYADSYTNLQNKLRLVTTGQTELAKATEITFAIAQRTSTQWDNVSTIYQKFSQNADRLGLSQERVAGLTDTVSKAIAISGATTEGAAAALMQFGQGLGGVALRGEEFNSITENAQGLALALAKGLGVSISQLKAMADQGQLTGDVVVKALEKAKSSVDKDFETRVQTISQGFQQIQNATTKFFGENTSGAAKILSESLSELSENLDLVANTGAAVAIGYITKATLSASIAGKERLSVLAAEFAATQQVAQAEVKRTGIILSQTRAAAAATLAEVNVARAEYNSAASAEARRTALGKLTTAQVADRAAQLVATKASEGHSAALIAETAATNRLAAAKGILMGMLGGPVGLIALVATVASGFYLMRDSSADAVKSIDIQGESVKTLIEKYKALNEEQRLFLTNDLQGKLEDKREQVNAVAASMEAYAQTFRDGFGSEKSAAIDAYFAAIQKGGDGAKNALKTLQETKALSPEQINEVAELGNKFRIADKAAGDLTEKLGTFKSQADKANETIDKNAKNLDKSAEAARNAKAAYDAYKQSFTGDLQSAVAEKTLQERNLTDNQRKALAEVLKKFNYSSASLKTDDGQKALKAALALAKVQDQTQAIVKARNDAEKAETKELERQEKLHAKITDLRIKGNQAIAGGNAHQGTLNLARTVQDSFDIKHFSAFNDKYHQGTNSKHTQGLAFDFTLKNAKESTSVVAALNEKLKELGINAKVINEYTDPSKRATGGHVHVQFASAAEADKYQKISETGKQGKLINEDLKDASSNYDDLLNLRSVYYSESEKLDAEHRDQLVEIYGKFADSPELDAMLAKENKRYEEDKQNYLENVQQKLSYYTDYTKSENELSINKFAQMRKDVAKFKEFDIDQRMEALMAIDGMEKDELASIKLREQQEILSAKQAYMTQMDYIRERYALERQEIALTQGKSEEWKRTMLEASKLNQGNEVANIQLSAGWAVAGLQSELNGTGEYFDAESQLAQRMAIVQQGLDAETLAIEDAVTLRQKIYKDYYDSINEITLNKGEEIFGSLASIAKDTAGEQSAVYKAMFAVSKGFAIAESVLKIQQALAQTLGDPTAITPAQKLANYGIIATQAASIFSNLNSVQLTGQAHSGIDSVPQDGTWLLQKGERVTTAQTSAKLDRTLDEVGKNGSGVNITINHDPSLAATTRDDGNGNITIDVVRREIAKHAPAAVANDIAGGSNTVTGKALRRNYKIERQL